MLQQWISVERVPHNVEQNKRLLLDDFAGKLVERRPTTLMDIANRKGGSSCPHGQRQGTNILNLLYILFPLIHNNKKRLRAARPPTIFNVKSRAVARHYRSHVPAVDCHFRAPSSPSPVDSFSLPRQPQRIQSPSSPITSSPQLKTFRAIRFLLFLFALLRFTWHFHLLKIYSDRRGRRTCSMTDKICA